MPLPSIEMTDRSILSYLNYKLEFVILKRIMSGNWLAIDILVSTETIKTRRKCSSGKPCKKVFINSICVYKSF